MIKFSPSILAADLTQLGCEAQRMERAGAQWLHVDVMDGHFVPNMTFGPDTVRALTRVTSLPLDVHLMIENPARYVAAFAAAGARLITFHWETVESAREARALITEIRAQGALAGVAIKPNTPADVLEAVADIVDMALVMTVEPGFGGQKLMKSCVDKLPQVCALLCAAGNPQAYVQVDGGITSENAADIVRAGANVLVMGTGLFKADDPAGIIAALRAQVEA